MHGFPCFSGAALIAIALFLCAALVAIAHTLSLHYLAMHSRLQLPSGEDLDTPPQLLVCVMQVRRRKANCKGMQRSDP